VKFEDLKVGDTFEVCGDEYINYRYPKICKCRKLSAWSAEEIDGVAFLMSAEDEVFVDMQAKVTTKI